MERFAEKLNRRMKELNLSQAKLEKKIGVAQSVISKWTTGQAEPKLGVARRLADALGLSLDYLTDDTRDSPAGAESKEDRMLADLIEMVGTDEALRRLVNVKTPAENPPYRDNNGNPPRGGEGGKGRKSS